MVCCCVPFCGSQRGKSKGVSFHEFPVTEIRNDWIKAISRKDVHSGAFWQPRDHSVVCSLHFKNTDYKDGLKIRMLQPNAVPTVFAGYPSYKVPKQRERKAPPLRRSPLVSCAASKQKSSNRAGQPSRSAASSGCKDDEVNGNENRPPLACRRPAEPLEEEAATFGSLSDVLEGRISRGTQVGGRERYETPREKRLKNQLRYAKKCVATLRRRVQHYKETIRKNNFGHLHKRLSNIKKAAESGNEAAYFLLDQIEYFGKERYKWSDSSLKLATLWRLKYPKGYEFARKINLLRLPSRTTLKRYTWPVPGLLDISVDEESVASPYVVDVDNNMVSKNENETQAISVGVRHSANVIRETVGDIGALSNIITVVSDATGILSEVVEVPFNESHSYSNVIEVVLDNDYNELCMVPLDETASENSYETYEMVSS